VLTRAGHQVETATSARAAIVLFEKFRPDVVVCDINMPDLNGRELLIIFREARRSAVLIATTGNATGVDDRFPVLEKPWSAADFEALVSAAAT
jgi:two-component system OmpR family response regulator